MKKLVRISYIKNKARQDLNKRFIVCSRLTNEHSQTQFCESVTVGLCPMQSFRDEALRLVPLLFSRVLKFLLDSLHPAGV